MGTHTQDMTVVGWVGSDLRTYHLDGAGGVPYTQFRLASTRRVLDRATGAFRDGPTLWFTVKAWRVLAVNLADSLRKGDPVVAVGRLGHAEWVAQDGGARSELVLEALAVGHDLGFGSAQFRRTITGPRRQRDDLTAAGGTSDAAGAPAEEDAFGDDPWATPADVAGVSADAASDGPPEDDATLTPEDAALVG